MKRVAALIVSAALLTGCATVQSILKLAKPPAGPAPVPGPAVAPPPAPVPTPAATPGVAPPSAPLPAPASTPPAVPASTPPAPAAPAPPAASSSGTAPAAPPPPAAPPSGGVLTVQLSAEQERRLREDTQKKLDDAERLLQRLEGRPLRANERETLVLAQSFVAEARKALSAQEYERAANLAAKAQTLSNDLVGAGR